MPNKPKTPQRAIRVPDERWEATGSAAVVVGANRSEIVNDLLAWWLRERGAKPPKRPPVSAPPEATPPDAEEDVPVPLTPAAPLPPGGEVAIMNGQCVQITTHGH